MPGFISRVLEDGDVGGPSGKLLGPGSPTVLAGFLPVSLVGDKVGPHGTAPHAKSVILTGAPTTLVTGKFPTAVGLSIASCGHPVVKGFTTVLVG